MYLTNGNESFLILEYSESAKHNAIGCLDPLTLKVSTVGSNPIDGYSLANTFANLFVRLPYPFQF